MGLIFGLQARPPIAHILGYLGYSHEVMPILQNLSHSTRAYIVNAEGLSGFVRKIPLIQILRKADEQELLRTAKRWQVIDLEILDQELKDIQAYDQQMLFLSCLYPSLYLFVLTHTNQEEKKNLFME